VGTSWQTRGKWEERHQRTRGDGASIGRGCALRGEGRVKRTRGGGIDATTSWQTRDNHGGGKSDGDGAMAMVMATRNAGEGDGDGDGNGDGVGEGKVYVDGKDDGNGDNDGDCDGDGDGQRQLLPWEAVRVGRGR
jgi:hypothetical protein